MRKFLATLTAICLVFWSSWTIADAFKPVDEPSINSPFERVAYYVKDITPTTNGTKILNGQGNSGSLYSIAVVSAQLEGEPVMATVIGYNSGYIALLSIKIGDRYFQQTLNSFGTIEAEIDKESAEMLAYNAFAVAEADGLFFRPGYVLYWTRNVDQGY